MNNVPVTSSSHPRRKEVYSCSTIPKWSTHEASLQKTRPIWKCNEQVFKIDFGLLEHHVLELVVLKETPTWFWKESNSVHLILFSQRFNWHRIDCRQKDFAGWSCCGVIIPAPLHQVFHFFRCPSGNNWPQAFRTELKVIAQACTFWHLIDSLHYCNIPLPLFERNWVFLVDTPVHHFPQNDTLFTWWISREKLT
jgi:hypothetical protein